MGWLVDHLKRAKGTIVSWDDDTWSEITLGCFLCALVVLMLSVMVMLSGCGDVAQWNARMHGVQSSGPGGACPTGYHVVALQCVTDVKEAVK